MLGSPHGWRGGAGRRRTAPTPRRGPEDAQGEGAAGGEQSLIRECGWTDRGTGGSGGGPPHEGPRAHPQAGGQPGRPRPGRSHAGPEGGGELRCCPAPRSRRQLPVGGGVSGCRGGRATRAAPPGSARAWRRQRLTQEAQSPTSSPAATAPPTPDIPPPAPTPPRSPDIPPTSPRHHAGAAHGGPGPTAPPRAATPTRTPEVPGPGRGEIGGLPPAFVLLPTVHPVSRVGRPQRAPPPRSANTPGKGPDSAPTLEGVQERDRGSHSSRLRVHAARTPPKKASFRVPCLGTGSNCAGATGATGAAGRRRWLRQRRARAGFSIGIYCPRAVGRQNPPGGTGCRGAPPPGPPSRCSSSGGTDGGAGGPRLAGASRAAGGTEPPQTRGETPRERTKVKNGN